MSIGRMNRGEFTDPPRAQSAINEEEWIANVVREHAAAFVLRNAIRELNPVIVDAETPDAYWVKFKQFVNNAHAKGLHPVLLLENPTIPDWVYEWGNTRFGRAANNVPNDLSVLIKQHEGLKGYQFDLNDVPVVSAPLAPGSSILLVLECLHRIDFLRPVQQNFVSATVAATPDAANLVDLKLTWRARSYIDRSYPSLQLAYSRKRRPKGDAER